VPMCHRELKLLIGIVTHVIIKVESLNTYDDHL